VIRSAWELRAGDRVCCLPCMSELEVLERGGERVAEVRYG
jgi:hypothetical protein